jgi:nucleoside-diphosphate-sugar epimerase
VPRGSRGARPPERNFASYDLAKEMLGYAPSISREEGIGRTWEWFEEHVFAEG